MKQTRLLMGMPITIEIVDPSAMDQAIDSVFAYFTYVDDKFSTYKDTSEISLLNQKRLKFYRASKDMKLVFALAKLTKRETNGYFDIARNGQRDPSGIVKGWAIYNAAALLRVQGFRNFYIDAGGDIQADGHNAKRENWRIGIRNPFKADEIVKVLSVTNLGVATSGTYMRGQHIYNPKCKHALVTEVVSLTVIGPNIYEADRFATAAFAMGRSGIEFIERLDGFEGYIIDNTGRATLTSGFERFTSHEQVH
jgi:FAD:protein FMN transferase